ncbi:hypothetical protein BHE74_00001703 [Ensete ventricosum]|uniref:Uncharacterized protein n=1 Tax=Ensete ventricosum TaxID=4639 RepID=A0A427B953_ENSVE|nr:hypothetical protein B296_00011959 [Ensete ventricosum]RWW89361.1 hypothetical protein BHE74_00001703 [Ensete ventricosum]
MKPSDSGSLLPHERRLRLGRHVILKPPLLYCLLVHRSMLAASQGQRLCRFQDRRNESLLGSADDRVIHVAEADSETGLDSWNARVTKETKLKNGVLRCDPRAMAKLVTAVYCTAAGRAPPKRDALAMSAESGVELIGRLSCIFCDRVGG